MDFRLAGASIALFLAAYAQSSPLFFIFGVRLDVALVLAVLMALSFTTVFEYTVLILVGTLGLAFGVGFPQALLFFLAIFILTRGVQLVMPWQHIFLGSILVIFFSLLTYIPHLAPLALREAFCSVVLFITIYALTPSHYVRKGGY